MTRRATSVYLVLLLGSAAGHWLCSTIQCPPGTNNIYASSLLDASVDGNCFTDKVKSIEGVTVARCASVCGMLGCAHVITGSGGSSGSCLLMGSGVGISKPPKLYRKTSPSEVEYEVARSKPASASSVAKQMEAGTQFIIGTDKINDGDLSNVLKLYHSVIGDLNPYLVIDLLKPYAIHKVIFWPRQGCACTSWRTRDITIYAGYTERPHGDFAGNYDVAYYYAGGFGDATSGGTGSLTFEINPVRCGRYIALKKEGVYNASATEEVMELMQIEVYTKDP